MTQENQERRSQHPFPDGPHLVTALLCEHVLEERDGVKSAIRIIDRTTRTSGGPGATSEMQPFTRAYFLLIRFKSGSARGTMPLQIRLMKPSGESPPPLTSTVNFEGEEDRGVDVVVKMELEIDVAGLWWFDIYLDEIRVTRVPLRIVYLPQPTLPVAPSGQSPPAP